MAPPTFAMDMTWPSLLKQLGIRTSHVLRRAELPDDFFAHASARLESAAYFRFWEALEAEAGPHSEPLPLRLYGVMRSESFSPALFAALCSPDLVSALHRLAKYKTLIAPLRLELEENAKSVTVRMSWLDATVEPPHTLVAAELLFFVCLARMGTHELIRPLRVVCPRPPPNGGAYEKFLGVPIRAGKVSAVSFSSDDAHKPFLSSNDAMWSVFEPELRRRAAQLDASATTRQRVHATLLEGLPGGAVGMVEIARRLALSKRTLQRRLEQEGTSFQEILRETRAALALHYLQRTTLPSAEISFLLGFDEPNSFFRAFNEWTGQTPDSVRRSTTDTPSMH